MPATQQQTTTTPGTGGWTADPPTEDGWFWYEGNSGRRTIVRVEQPRVTWSGVERPTALADVPPGKWRPIAEPQGP